MVSHSSQSQSIDYHTRLFFQWTFIFKIFPRVDSPPEGIVLSGSGNWVTGRWLAVAMKTCCWIAASSLTMLDIIVVLAVADSRAIRGRQMQDYNFKYGRCVRWHLRKGKGTLDIAYCMGLQYWQLHRSNWISASSYVAYLWFAYIKDA